MMNRRPRSLYDDLPGSLRWFGVPLEGSAVCLRAVNLKPTKAGYYCVAFQGYSTHLHRLILSWKLGRTLKTDEVARHSCGHQWCVNPLDIVLGSHLDNMRDQYGHGTRVRGERHPASKLTDQQVLEIRSSSVPDRVVAASLGVARQTVNDIRRGKTRRPSAYATTNRRS